MLPYLWQKCAISSAAACLEIINSESVGIYSFSQSALQALKFPKGTSALATDCKQVLKPAPSFVDLVWNPGHKVIEGNEKQASSQERDLKSLLWDQNFR
ncbi:unnamed protein product [Nezara viridula]|uniref:Uncharacterized protein n=1 Tax=Nezara viridula TaxID=85310 RepID=A0A9P0HNR1_NEZVI|nr:unnamed protein product [Nezara viridula]